MTNRHTLKVKYDSNTGEHYLQFTPDMLAQVGWDFGDAIVWKDNLNGSYTLSKKVDNNSGNEKTNGETDGNSSPKTDRDSTTHE